ncbi:hypothetical protein [Serratia fonticola]|uniref:hypothetical protein n=1 Tax=Serratia fonticola TaxID=47917 RepID=UPI00217BA279|nr:hypothetical protein [Serratia fonticola]CAI2004307.1 Uncharacterised protein [Serratia fonticola]
MIWQGIPFKYLGAEPLQQAFLSVSHIPDIVVKSGFALDTFLSGFCAGAIPAIVAIVAMRSNAKNIQEERKHQQQLTNKNITMQFISASRQVWINEIRDTAAKYVGSATAVLNNVNAMVTEYNSRGSETEYYNRMSDKTREAANELGLLTTKFELLLDPTEDASKRVIESLGKCREFILKKRKNNEKMVFDELVPYVSELKESTREVVRKKEEQDE